MSCKNGHRNVPKFFKKNNKKLLQKKQMFDKIKHEIFI